MEDHASVSRLAIARTAGGVIALVALWAQTDLALATTIEESIQAALETNPEVGVVAADREAIEQELRQARAEYLPSIDVRGAAGPEYTDSPNTRNRIDDDDTETLLRLESQLTLTQMLFDGFATQSEVQRQIARIDSASYRVEEAAEFIALDAVEAHLDVLRNQALVELARENLEQHRRILGQVRQLEDQGAGSIGDVRQAESRLAEAESSLALAQGNLLDAEAFYLAVVGSSPVDLEEGVAPVSTLPESPDASAAAAWVTSPTVQLANADIDVAQAELRAARAGYYPNLDLELGAAAGDNLDGLEGRDVNAQALLVLRYNLFRGGGDIAREREAFLRVKEARENLRVAQRDAEQEARVAYHALTTARARLAALGDGVDAQRATRDIYAQQFDLGQRGLLDLLDAENELFIDRSNLVTATFTERFAVYRVLAVIGAMLDSLEIDRPAEAISIYRDREQRIYGTAPAQVRD
ncbi:MAG TPA: TolC family outer membrane protein [Geminicoccaceae bacterium]|jgi:adhesin transport system outer membrane protein|nr:TolC family outer membrane protein [Geminicoccaceae bacterium]